MRISTVILIFVSFFLLVIFSFPLRGVIVFLDEKKLISAKSIDGFWWKGQLEQVQLEERPLGNIKINYLPLSLSEQLKSLASNNIYGELIKIFMITASGAEGISLKNVRFVHIMEPYWHPTRIKQVIGRARRICSHQDLPEEHRTVDVFLYLMTFTEKQLAPTVPKHQSVV